MSPIIKYSYEEKIRVCEDYLSGKRSESEIAHEYGFCKLTGAMWRWINLYREHGATALLPKTGNNSYSKEFKIKIVEEVMEGNGSAEFIAAKYKISSSTLHAWISVYNSGMELKDYIPEREVYMAEARRKTTIEERKEIVKYCIEHNRDYKSTASLYNVSYNQVYSWVKKYDHIGEDGLTDKRGRHKRDDEVDELERLRRENLRLKRQLEEKDMAVGLLKKVKEFERM